MDFQLLLGLLLTILPITELRGGLPVIVDYCLKNGLSIWPFFLLVILLNALVIFAVYSFLEFFHEHLLKWKFYARIFDKLIEKIRKKHEKFERRFNEIGYLALILFVGVPLPVTGAWTGTFLAWLLGLEKKKAIGSIAIGVLIAGLIILLLSQGLIGLFYS